MKAGDRFFVFIQHLLPQHFLSAIVYRLTRCQWPYWKNYLIRIFIWKFGVDMDSAERKGPETYSDFNDFFTRRLKAGVRPVDSSDSRLVSPVDGVISQLGLINDDAILQAKGKSYSLKMLLADDAYLTQVFRNGQFMTIYLSPKDYHRIHMPFSGELSRMTYVPGDLFSVNEVTTNEVDNLFARNERVINIFQTRIGKVALVMVGAIFVGSMETVWAGQITPTSERKVKNWNYSDSNPRVNLEKGEEMGRFNMGSTVILLLEPEKCHWDAAMQAGTPLRMGELIGTTTSL